RSARNVAGDARERLAVVGGLVQTNGEVLVIAALLRDIDGGLVVLRRQDLPDPFLLRRQARRQLLPFDAVVQREVQTPIVGAGIDETFLLRRLGDRDDELVRDVAAPRLVVVAQIA